MKETFRAIRIKSRTELDWFIEHLTHEAFRARDHWNFLKAFDESLHHYSVELNQTPNFWELTRTAHKDTVILRLGRLYDPNAMAISLGTLLQTMNKHASTPGIELLPGITKLDRSKLEKEIVSVSDSDPTVKKLLTVRNEYLAHRSSQHVAKGNFKTLPTLQRRDIAKLINRAIGILQKYRKLLEYPTLLCGNYNVEEFKKLLVLLRAGRQSTAKSSRQSKR